jgi:hypothetical protein
VHVLPDFAYGEGALYAAPWFAQVGQALARVIGVSTMVQAHAGRLPWAEALPGALQRSLERAGFDDYCAHRQPHLLSNGFRPQPWLKLICLAAAGEELRSLDEAARRPWREISSGPETEFDELILSDALRAMCLRNRVDAGHFVVERAAPRGPVLVDLEACCVFGEGGPHDHGRLAYWFPPAIAARLRARGIAGYIVELDTPDALDELVGFIREGAPGRRGQGFLLTRK